MNFKEKKVIKTKYNPNIIEYNNDLDIYIIGTYHYLTSNNNNQHNNRLGNLILMNTCYEILDDYECVVDGGCFHLKLITATSFAVSHSNGYLTLYSINSLKINQLLRIKTLSSLLTCVVVVIKNNPIINDFLSFIVSDSDGMLTSIQVNCDLNAVLNIKTMNACQQSIWCLFVYQLNDTCFLFVGSDDNKWRVYDNNTFEEIYINNDCYGGVTSFAYNQNQLIVGSYDEHIRYYQLNYENLTFTAQLMHKIHINNSGIWSIIVDHKHNYLIVAAMYAGVYLIDQNQQLIKVYDKQNELIYGIQSNSDFNQIVFASFYSKSIYCFQI